jgi:hypothetical protein
MGKKLNQFHINKLHGRLTIDRKKKFRIGHGKPSISKMNSIIVKNVVSKTDGSKPKRYERRNAMSKELIWVTVPHQLPPVAVWYENKQELIDALNEHELSDDMRNTIDDFDEVVHWASMKYNSTRIIDWSDYQELRAESYKQFKHQRYKVEYEVEQIAEDLDWKK